MSHLLQMRGLKLLSKVLRLLLAWSHLLQMRGLKRNACHICKFLSVASFTDAWIETVSMIARVAKALSHLLQMRGLKHFSLNRELHGHESHLLQMRGLKPQYGY